MKIEFSGPVYPINQFALKAFAEILNTILTAEHALGLSNQLTLRDASVYDDERTLNGYFKWVFDNRSFRLWQRTSYKSDVCFPQQIFKVDYAEIADKENRSDIIIN